MEPRIRQTDDDGCMGITEAHTLAADPAFDLLDLKPLGSEKAHVTLSACHQRREPNGSGAHRTSSRAHLLAHLSHIGIIYIMSCLGV